MEWIVEKHKFMEIEFFIVGTEVVHEGFGPQGRHNILVEYKGRDIQWVARDACDRGEESMSLYQALLSYIKVSKEANRSKVGHCGWMIDVGLPSLESGLDNIIKTIMGTYSPKGSVN
jgi:hypothetical protein